MIERETRKYEVESIEHPSHPDFKRAYQMLWEGFGAAGEMEPESVIRQMLLDDSTRRAALRHLRPLLPAGRARPGDRHDPRRPRRPRAGEPGLRPEPLPGLSLAHLHVARGARHGAHLLAADRAPRPRRQLSACAAPEGPDRAAGARRAGALLRHAGRPGGRDRVLQPRGQALAPAHPLLRPRRLRRDRPQALPLPAAGLPRPRADRAHRRPAGAVHVAAAPGGPRAGGAPADRRSARRDPAPVRRLRDLLRADPSGQQPRRGARRGSRSGARRGRTTSRCCRFRPARAISSA